MENNYWDMQGREIVIQDESNESTIQHNQCGRCRAKIEKWMYGPRGKYCWTCFQMGTIMERSHLVTVKETNDFVVADKILQWNGKLTTQQQAISDRLCQEERRNQLVHAVTGAGKTEMLYSVLEKYLVAKKRVAFVAPRVDVVHEIAARLKLIFNIAQGKMTGDTPDLKTHDQLVFATVHQLFKFKDAFDLIVVDECDAFPLQGNEWLKGAINKALKPRGRLICLTATMSKELLQRFNIHAQDKLTLYKRFHGYPLPNLTINYCRNWRKKLPDSFITLLTTTEHQLLIFVPEVSDCITLKKWIESNTKQSVGSMYAGASLRQEMIEQFKANELTILVTTILLERGITFPKIDVIILGAESAVFTSATLVQIAGRCGRSIARPTGNVYVYTRWKMRKINKAYQEIKRMNR